MFLNRRQRGVFCHQWQTGAWELAGVLFFTSFDGLISRERGGFVWDWKWLEHFGNGQQFWKLVNLVWTWLFLEFLINSVLIPSGCDSKMSKMLSKITKYDWNNTCGWAVRKKKSNKFRFKFNSNQLEKCRKGWMCLKCLFLWNVSKLVEKTIVGFKTRRRGIENGLKQVKLVNNSGFIWKMDEIWPKIIRF